MTNQKHILISLESCHAENILSGKKKLEFRSRKMHVDVGTTVWIYVKMPVGSVIGKAQISACHFLAPSTLWRKFSGVSGLTRKDFFDYFQHVEKGFALSLVKAERLSETISLDALRKVSPGFQPPQFFTHIPNDSVLLTPLQNKKPK